jgi:hypothetical protein
MTETSDASVRLAILRRVSSLSPVEMEIACAAPKLLIIELSGPNVRSKAPRTVVVN